MTEPVLMPRPFLGSDLSLIPSHELMVLLLLGGLGQALVAAPLRADHMSMSSAALRMSAGGEPMLSRRSAAAAAAASVFFSQALPAQAECSKFSPLCGTLPDVVALTAPGSADDGVPPAFRSIKGSPFDNEARKDAEDNSVQASLDRKKAMKAEIARKEIEAEAMKETLREAKEARAAARAAKAAAK